MAQSIDKSTNLTSDVYGINSYVNEIKKNFTPTANEETLMLGIFGYAGQMFSDLMQNSIVMASEFSNESIATKAKFEKNVIAHARGLGITGIDAVPATMEVLLTFVEEDIENAIGTNPDGGWSFTFDKDTAIYIGKYPFFVDYDIEIQKIRLENSGIIEDFTYTAKYIIDDDNPISDITNPYISSPVKMMVSNKSIIFMPVKLHQVMKTNIVKKILSDNSISSKTLTFEFEGQLAAFNIDVTEGDKVTHLIPVYEGLISSNKKYPYFYYSYLDSKTIRIKFDRSSYAPRINSEVKINIWTTEGEGGNFSYAPEVYPGFACESEKYGYANIACEVRPVDGESSYGSNKKTIEELQQLIPREASARGAITNLTDLENFFNALDTDDSKIYLYKKRDNALERLYYSFILIRDAYNNIIPTNTVDVKAYVNDLVVSNENGNKRYTLPRGELLKLTDDGTCMLISKDNIPADFDPYKETEDAKDADGFDYKKFLFYYTSPYNFTINHSPAYGTYNLTIMDSKKFLEFSHINDKSLYQYIATVMNCYRGTNEEESNDYSFTIKMEQNISNANENDKSLQVFAVFYDSEGTPYTWAQAECVNVAESTAVVYTYKFKFKTDNYMDTSGRLRITEGMFDKGITVKGMANPLRGEYDTVEEFQTIQDPVIGDYAIAAGEYYKYDGTEWIKQTMKLSTNESYVPANCKCVLYMLYKADGEMPIDWQGLDAIIPEFNAYKYENPKITGYESMEKLQEVEKPVEGEYALIGETYYQYNGTDWVETEAPVTGYVFDKVANIRDYTLANTYNVTEGVDFFYNYSEVIDSPIVINSDENGEYFIIKGMPVVKYNYFDTEDKAIELCRELVRRKNYIDYAVTILEDAFGIDFKFFNTYGPSKLFVTDEVEQTCLDRTNISLKFRLKLRANYNKNVVNSITEDIKNYVEDITSIESLHIPNLITEITSKYRESIVYFEFVGINDYGTSVQHLHAQTMPDSVVVPEFLSIHTILNREGKWVPDITIQMV